MHPEPENLLQLANLTSLISLAGIWALAVMLPGPNFLLVAKCALEGRMRHGLHAALGISLGAVLWSGASLLGLALLFERQQWLYELLRLAGGCYLVWIGLQTARAGFVPGSGAAMTRPVDHKGRSHILLGLLTSLSNPKTAAFFTSIFATLHAPDAPGWVAVASVLLVFAISFAWYAWLALAFSHGRVQRVYCLARRPLNIVLGGLFLLLGVRLATAR